MNADHAPYLRFTNRAQLNKAVNTLIGLIEGIAIDGHINEGELSFLNLWMRENEQLRNRHPYTELLPVVEQALQDGVLTEEERQDILWLCKRLRSDEFYDAVTGDMQRLHALLGGIVADGQIDLGEIDGLRHWLDEHEHLRRCWPYDEIDSLLIHICKDRVVTEQEKQLLQGFFSEFLAVLDGRTLVSPSVEIEGKVVGLCAVAPSIEFEGSVFCFTGTSSRHPRAAMCETVVRLGGIVAPNLTKKVSYLVIGADGNPCWSYSCYGRKVEQAVKLRKEGSRILIIHENDFHDAVQDA